MLELKKQENSNIINLIGQLDTNSVTAIESTLLEYSKTMTELILNFSQFSYISSAGLRLLLTCQKNINTNNGTMTLINVNEVIYEILEVIGFTEILTIK